MALTGCASKGAGALGAAPASAPTAAASTAGPSAAAPAPAPAPVSRVDGLGYDQLSDAIGDGNEKRVKPELVGKTTTLTLAKAGGKGALAGTWVAADGDGTFFRCRATARGFDGGTVTTKIRDYRFVARAKQKIVDLERCAVAAAEPARAASAPAPAPQATAPSTVGAGKAGMDARGNVVDSSKVEAGSGRTVKGVNNYEGEITGNPGAGSKFTRLQIGMPAKQVTDLIGAPTDQGVYVTGKAFIPFYFGGDRHRFEMTYKGQGRLVFAGGGMGDYTGGNLIWIIHNANETGYR